MNTHYAMAASVILFGIIGSWGLYMQTKKIWTAKSAASISGTAVITLTAYMASFIMIGTEKSDPFMIFHGEIRTLFWGPVIIGFLRYGKMSWKHVALIFGCAAMYIAGMNVRSLAAPIFTVFTIMSVWFTLVQAYTIVANGKRGTVAIQNQIIPGASTLVWVSYAIYLRDWPLISSFGMSTISYIAVIGAWVKYPNPESQQPSTST